MKKYLEESIGAHWHRKPRPPLRTFNEFCEMFGTTRGVLLTRLKLEGAPKSKFSTRNASSKATWYDIKEMRDWWAAFPDSKKSQEAKA